MKDIVSLVVRANDIRHQRIQTLLDAAGHMQLAYAALVDVGLKADAKKLRDIMRAAQVEMSKVLADGRTP